jgi:hypothetical protein
VAKALADLQIYIAKRYDGNPPLTLTTLRSYYQSSNDSQNVLRYILEERRKEFMHEGLRWFDIKRYQISVIHDLENGGLIELTANDKRKILQIPQTAIDVGGLEPNPR